MIRRKLALFLFAIALFLAGNPANASGITWGDSLDAALRTARKTGKPIMVDFYADWCGWCKRLDSDVYTDAAVVKTATQFINVKLDTDRNGRDAARHYGVSSLPTVLILNGEGEVEARFNGYSPAPTFNSKLTEAAVIHRDLPGLLTRYRTNASDLEAAFRLTQIYARRGNENQAQRSLARVAKLDPSDTKGRYAKSLNIVADMYASRSNFEEAIPLFKRAVKAGQNATDVGYGQLSLALCQFFRRDLDAAQAELKAALANPKISERDKADARKMQTKLAELAQRKG